jgi:hypothetical protein
MKTLQEQLDESDRRYHKKQMQAILIGGFSMVGILVCIIIALIYFQS